MASFQDQLQHVLANRRSPEARALYVTLLGYVERRVQLLRGGRYSGLLSAAEAEEVVSEVGLKLVRGALARFRGESMAELMAYVRVITDRSVGRAARGRVRERAAMVELGPEHVQDLLGAIPHPERSVEVRVGCPLSERDEHYLVELLQAGSKAEYARMQGQSRAAVTRMVQRIRDRIGSLAEDERVSADVWMHQAARTVLDGDTAPLPA